MKFQDVLFDLRKQKRLSQKELAQEVGYSVSIITKWERGEREPKASALICLSKYFEVTIEFLLGIA